MIRGIYAVLGIYLITAARNPGKNRSLISFIIWSSVVHAAIMGTQALYDSREYGHLVGDVPALLLVAAFCICSLQRGNGSSGRLPKTALATQDEMHARAHVSYVGF